MKMLLLAAVASAAANANVSIVARLNKSAVSVHHAPTFQLKPYLNDKLNMFRGRMMGHGPYHSYPQCGWAGCCAPGGHMCGSRCYGSACPAGTFDAGCTYCCPFGSTAVPGGCLVNGVNTPNADANAPADAYAPPPAAPPPSSPPSLPKGITCSLPWSACFEADVFTVLLGFAAFIGLIVLLAVILCVIACVRICICGVKKPAQEDARV